MLVNADCAVGCYRIAINNASGAAELISDFSYLDAVPPGILTFDFSHMAAPLTQENREDYLPGNFGYQPTLHLLEVVAAIAAYTNGEHGTVMHKLVAVLPKARSRVGQFLKRMGLPDLLKEMGLQVEFDAPATAEFGGDDTTRENLIALTTISDGNDNPQLALKAQMKIDSQIDRVFSQALPENPDLACSFTTIVQEAVDNLIHYGQGGIIAGLYYPRAGEVEITLVNRCGGFGGKNPTEQLEALVSACEGNTHRVNGGGNGIAQLSRLAMACFGTLVLRNGGASLYLLPNGSISGNTVETGLPTLGASVTILLQLLPSTISGNSLGSTEPIDEFKAVLANSLETYLQKKWKQPNQSSTS